MLCFSSLPSANHSLKFSALRISSVVVHIKRTGAVANIKAVVYVRAILKTASACRLESELHGSRISSCKYDPSIEVDSFWCKLKARGINVFYKRSNKGKDNGSKIHRRNVVEIGRYVQEMEGS